MFRSTTKHDVRSQDELRSLALKSFTRTEDTHNNDIYATTYGIELPRGSLELLNKVILGLTCNCSTANSSRRTMHTMIRGKLGDTSIIRICFLQPEVVTSTAHLPPHLNDDLVREQTVFVSAPPFPSPGRVRKLSRVSEVSGRLSPYIVEAASLNSVATWSYSNITRSKFVLTLTTHYSYQCMGMTYDSIRIISSFKDPNVSFRYDENLRHFCANISPPEGKGVLGVGNNTSLIVYSDGSFRVNGSPSASYDVCRAFSDCVTRLFSSAMMEVFLKSLVRL